METIRGYVGNIIFRNPENGYTVFEAVCGEEKIICVGIFSILSEGETIHAEGIYTEHPVYGRQLQVKTLEECEPEDEASMERYLGSGAVKGIGMALAARIVRCFGADTFRIIEEEPERLSEVRGISGRKAMEIASQVVEKKDMRHAMIFLQKYGISLNLAMKIYQKYKQDIYRILKENPYQLADDIQGIGFLLADEIASKAGVRVDSDYRIQSGILYSLFGGAAEGNTYLPRNELTEAAAKLLGVEADLIEKNYMDLAIEKKIIVRGEQIYSAPYYHMEAACAGQLHNLNCHYEIRRERLMQHISRIAQQNGMEFDEMQIRAVTEAAEHGISIITGGPGTGKTTAIRLMIEYFESEGQEIFLAAPTGRAAKRMSEAAGREAKTIHRMLELNGDADGSAGFARNAQYPLEADVIIIDEVSMVDIGLLHALLAACVPGTRLVFVGDVNQLPSVGPGNVLKDMIDSGAFPVVRLAKIFRQAAGSDIIRNAHKINAGEQVRLDNQSKDFFFLKRYDADAIVNVTLQLIVQKLPKYVGAPMLDIQVLAPMKKGLLGAERFNAILQQYLNPKADGKKETEAAGCIFREGDKVMQTKNNYRMAWEIKGAYGFATEKGIGVFNGDMGIIREINAYAKTMTVEFDEGRVAEYSLDNLKELALAYAVTIHKSQGSEYPAVVIPLFGGPKMLMSRNLLYTAVTRAKKCVTLVGDETVFSSMIQNIAYQKRYSGLCGEIQKNKI